MTGNNREIPHFYSDEELDRLILWIDSNHPDDKEIAKQIERWAYRLLVNAVKFSAEYLSDHSLHLLSELGLDLISSELLSQIAKNGMKGLQIRLSHEPNQPTVMYDQSDTIYTDVVLRLAQALDHSLSTDQTFEQVVQEASETNQNFQDLHPELKLLVKTRISLLIQGRAAGEASETLDDAHHLTQGG